MADFTKVRTDSDLHMPEVTEEETGQIFEVLNQIDSSKDGLDEDLVRGILASFQKLMSGSQ